MQKLRVAIIGDMPANAYSGGRYHAWMMAEALSCKGNDVFFITNNIPIFFDDFCEFPGHSNIKIILTNDYYDIDWNMRLDYVVCVPGISMGNNFYNACVYFAKAAGARFAFINFETPNWYEKYTRMNRPLEDYETLKQMCRYGCLIFSSAIESQNFAKLYYSLHYADTEFQVWSPPINSLTADSIQSEKVNQVMLFARFKDKHKGGEDILSLFGEYLCGWTFLIVTGTAEIPAAFMSEAKLLSQKYGIALQVERKLSDAEKFRALKRSKILLFPSYFEGYGYPPVEALYCGAQCVAYDLPVLREICGDSLVYCERGRTDAVREALQKLIGERKETGPVILDTADFFRQANRLQKILEDNLTNQKLESKFWDAKMLMVYGYLRKRMHLLLLSLLDKIYIPPIIRYCIKNNIVISKKLKIENETWDKVKKNIEGKQIYVWGCGQAWHELYPIYRKKLKVKGIVDQSMQKQGKVDRASGKFVIQSPSVLQKSNIKELVVIIAVKEGVDEIIGVLEASGIQDYHSLCMIEMNSIKARFYNWIHTNKVAFLFV